MHRVTDRRLSGDLVVDDVPGVWHSGIILPGEGVIANTGGAESIAGNIQRVQTGAVALNVKSSQGSQGATQ